MLILASASPRRRELLQLITPQFKVIAKETNETLPPDILPAEAVRLLARRKAEAVSLFYPQDTVIGADTVVALDNLLLGKPENERHAREMLRSLSGRQHSVFTGVAVLYPGGREVFYEETVVRFTKISDRLLEEYVASGEPMDKAGAYGIQGQAALFISGILGDYYNVMGLPVCRLHTVLQKLWAGRQE